MNKKLSIMDHKDIKFLFSELENNRKNFSNLQLEFIDSLKKQYKVTGLLTSLQASSLLDLRDKTTSTVNITDTDFISGLYSQLQESYY